MKRLATLVLAASLSLGALVTTGQGASATPFSDVPANHWAYQAIQSLAADGLVEGYPDGRFKGDRPLSRYEMAVIVARVVAKLQANGANYASKADLDKLQKLIDALKDELDALGVRVTNLEDALDALDKRTKLAQSLQLHGFLQHRLTARQRTIFPKSVNGAPLGGGLTTAADIGGFDTAFLTSDSSNSPLAQAGAGNQINVDDKITLSYAINENLTVSLPFHILTYSWGGEYSSTAHYSVYPDIVVNVAKAGALSAAYFRFGQLDNLKSSRLGLAYRAPDASGYPSWEIPAQPYQKGVEFGGLLNGITEFQVSFSRLDQTQIYTATNVLDPTGETNINAFLFTTVRPQAGYTQNGYPNAPTGGALQVDTFSAGTGSLASVYLTRKAVAGTVYVSFYNGCSYNSAGVVTAAPTGGTCPSLANFRYNDNQNQVIFPSPLPAGSTVGITYVGLNGIKDSTPELYMVNARLNQKFKGVPGLEVGLSFNRIFAMDDNICNGTGGTTTTAGAAVPTQTCISAGVGAPAASGNNPVYGQGLVSDTVLGLDAQLPLAIVHFGGDATQVPILYGEAAYSKYSPDFRTVPSVTDSAGVIGVRVKIYRTTASLQYQRVGANFFSGAPIRYFGPAPQLFSFWRAGFFPGFFGFANNLGINQTFDGFAKTNSATNSATTFIYPVFNPFVATGPQYFSNFAPNTTGLTFNLGTPIRLGDTKLNGTLLVQSLQELQANGFGPLVYSQVGYPQTGLAAGAGNASNVKMNYTNVQGGLTFSVPAFGQNVAFNLTGAIDHLQRNDKTIANGYVPINPSTQTADPTYAAAAAAAGAGNPGNPGPAFYPNYVNMYHTTYGFGATVPVTRDVSIGGVYNTQKYYGSYGTTVQQNIDERKDIYTFTATYNIPRTTSAISAAFRNQQYKDNVLPSYNFSQNREDVNFVIRF